jgi:Domain of unknown function (DUF362)
MTHYATALALGSLLFSAFDFNRAYADTDVMVSLAKLKNHLTAGVTLAVKNLFGITPNSLYGGDAAREEATAGRDPLHSPTGGRRIQLLLAEQAGLGTADLAQIDVRGRSIAEARCPYR